MSTVSEELTAEIESVNESGMQESVKKDREWYG